MDPPSSQTNLGGGGATPTNRDNQNRHNTNTNNNNKPQLPPAVSAAFAHIGRSRSGSGGGGGGNDTPPSFSQSDLTNSTSYNNGNTSGNTNPNHNNNNHSGASNSKTTNSNTNSNTSKTLPHNVDICITCVTDKPPQLPLREELPSLGIEVVYNAQGIGAKASQQEAKHLLKKFRHDEQYKDLKKRRLFAPSHASVVSTLADRQKQEDALEIPRGISYEKYEKILSSSNSNLDNDNGDDSTMDGACSNSVSTSHTQGSFASSSLGEKRKQDKYGMHHHTKKKRIVSSTTTKGLPLKFSFQNPSKSPLGAAGDDHSIASSSQTSSVGMNILPASSPFSKHSQQQLSSHQQQQQSNTPTNLLSPTSSQQVGKQQPNPNNNNLNNDITSTPSSGFSSAPAGQYTGPPTKTSPGENTTSNSHAGSLTHTSQSAGGLLKTVFQAFSGEHHQPRRDLHRLEEQRSVSEEETPSPSKSDSTSSDYPPSRSGEDDDDDDQDELDRNNERRRRQQQQQQRRYHQAPQSPTTEPHFTDIRPNPTRSPKSPQESTTTSQNRDDHNSSSQDVSRDPSSISTNFTTPKNTAAAPVQVVASNDPTVKRFLPGLQTVPSGSSSTGSDPRETSSDPSSDSMIKEEEEEDDDDEEQQAGGAAVDPPPKRQQPPVRRRPQQQQPHQQRGKKDPDQQRSPSPPEQRHYHRGPLASPQRSLKDPPVLPPKDPPLTQAFQAFNTVDQDIYETLGPVAAAAVAQRQNNNNNNHASKRQRRQAPDPPHSPSKKEAAPQFEYKQQQQHQLQQQFQRQQQQQQQLLFQQQQQQHPHHHQHQQRQQQQKRPQRQVASPTWMNSAKLALENVAAEVYKQATRSGPSPMNQTDVGVFFPSTGTGTGTPPSNGTPPDQIQKQTGKQPQPLSPTSTLSSNTANQQQQQQIQIHGHKPFLFPAATIANNAASNNYNNMGGGYQHQNQQQNTFINNNNNNISNNSNITNHNPFPHHPHVEVHVRSDGTQVVVSSSIGTKSVTAFYEALQQPKTPVDSIQRMLRVCPGLVKVRLQSNGPQKGRLGLHTACARGFPHHHSRISASSSSGLALELVEDIQQLKRLISVLVEANRGACTVLDDRADLPAHLLARTLMEWEAQWYEKVYEKVQKDQDTDGRNAAAITKLYQSMSQCIEIVLHPVAAFCNAAANATLCRAPGSVGLLLPLHIASIFTASVPTLRQLLEQDPAAATVPCNLGHLRTFIPDHSLPLELHDKLSTDFPKWEIGAEARKSKPIQIAGGSQMIIMEDYMRRSDLLFAFHPTVPRFRMETTRIERLEAKVIAEANQMDQKFRDKGEHGQLSVAVKRIWIWLCTFQDINDHFQATYYSSVKRILDSVPASTIPYLASVKTMTTQHPNNGNNKSVSNNNNSGNKPLSQVAAPECQALLRTRLEEYESSQASRLEQMVAQAVATAAKPSTSPKSSVADGSQDDTTTTNATAFLSLKGKGYVGVLCRTLFHIHEDSMPTSFILLPYKLTKNDQGKLGIDKQSSAATAVKFAECLLQLTDPKTILYFLEQKSIQGREQRISSDVDDETSKATRKRCQEAEDSLIALYEPGKAYLYLIDELIGLPIVPASSSSLYPIELTQPSNIVRKLLPLMLTGMILMRGEKALSVLVNVLLDKTVRQVSPNWVDAAREITAYLYSQQDSRSENSLPGLDALIEELRAFVTNNSSVKHVTDISENTEWAIELSILRMVVSMNDNKRSFAGLKAKRDEPGTVLWTKHKIEEEMRSESKSAAVESSQKKPDASVTYYHEDPPGMVVRPSTSTSSSKASTKKSGNQTNDDHDSASAAAKSAKSARSQATATSHVSAPSHATAPSSQEVTSPVSPLTESPGTGSLGTPKTREDSGASGADNIEKLRMQSTLSTPDSKWLAAEADANPEKDDASIEEADSGFDGEELAGVRILLEAEEGPSLLDQESTTEDEGSGSENDLADKYKSLFERTNDSGSDSVRRKGTTAPIEIVSSGSGEGEENRTKKAGVKAKPTNKKQIGTSSRPTTTPKALSSDSGESSSGEPMILPAKEIDSRTTAHRDKGKNNVKNVYLDVTESSGSDDQSMSKSSQTTKVSLLNQASREQESEESRSESPSGDTQDDTNESKSYASKSIGTNESKSVARYNSSESDDDDDAVLKFDFIQDARSHSSKSVPSATMERSTDRLYDESRIEVIDHHSLSSDVNSVLSTGKMFENETMRLHDYALHQLTTQSTSAPPSPPSSPSPSPPNEDISPVSYPSEPSKTSTSKQSSTRRSRHSNQSNSHRDSHDDALQQITTATTFAELQPASPVRSSPSSVLKSKTPSPSRSSQDPSPKLSARSSNATPSSTPPRKLPPQMSNANAMLENLVKDTEDKLTLSSATQSPAGIHIMRYGRENFVKKDVTFLDMREQLTDQALKVDCLESTLESIRIREDKLLSRGEMLQDFLSDLLDQSENMHMDTERAAKKVERRLSMLEERLLCTEIETQHLSFGVYAIGEEEATVATEDYNRELSDIYQQQVQQQQRIEEHEHRDRSDDEILGRTATVDRRRHRSPIHRSRSPGGRASPARHRSPSRRSLSSRRRRMVSEDSELSSLDAGGYEGSMYVLDGYSSNPDVENTSEFAVDGYSRQQSSKSRSSRYSYDDYYVPYESTRPQPKPHNKSYNHHPHPNRRRRRPRPDYDMNQLLRNASLDERSIEFEMGQMMFGTLDHSSSTESPAGHTTTHHHHHHTTTTSQSRHVHINISSTTTASGSPNHPIRCNSLDAYEQMRDEYRMGLGISSFHHGISGDDAASHQSYSSAGEYTAAMDIQSLEGDGLDWVKMSARQFEVQTYRQ